MCNNTHHFNVATAVDLVEPIRATFLSVPQQKGRRRLVLLWPGWARNEPCASCHHVHTKLRGIQSYQRWVVRLILTTVMYLRCEDLIRRPHHMIPAPCAYGKPRRAGFALPHLSTFGFPVTISWGHFPLTGTFFLHLTPASLVCPVHLSKFSPHIHNYFFMPRHAVIASGLQRGRLVGAWSKGEGSQN